MNRIQSVRTDWVQLLTRVIAMLDIVFVTVSILFFVAGAAYVAGCRRLD